MKLIIIISIVTLIFLIGLIALILYLIGVLSFGNNYRYCVPPGQGVDCSKPCNLFDCGDGICVDFPRNPC